EEVGGAAAGEAQAPTGAVVLADEEVVGGLRIQHARLLRVDGDGLDPAPRETTAGGLPMLAAVAAAEDAAEAGDAGGAEVQGVAARRHDGDRVRLGLPGGGDPRRALVGAPVEPVDGQAGGVRAAVGEQPSSVEAEQRE